MLPPKNIERRAKARFPLQQDVRYKVLEDNRIVGAGMGKTVDISSSGLALSIDQQVTPGAFMELSISWPVLLDNSTPMRLIVFGRVMPARAGKTVCTVDKYEFRTQAKALQAVVPMRSDSMLQRWADGLRRETLKTRTA